MKVWRKGNKKSLGILCESFIKQFLYWRATITLEQAARRISDKIDESKLKTKVRRLYDIANVLAALNLIEKTSLETRKPAFKWVGESGLQLFIEEMENVLKVQNNEIFISNEFCDSKVALFEFKSENLNPTENPKKNRFIQRLNSENNTIKIKTSILDDEEQIVYKSSTPKSTNLNYELNLNNKDCNLASRNDSTKQIIELLEKLGVSKQTYPVYKPTPVYPIHHYLSNSCSVSVPPLIWLGASGNCFAQNMWRPAKKVQSQS